MSNLTPPPPPNLPLPQEEFSKLYLMQLTNVLRLFFTGLWSMLTNLLSNTNTTAGTHPGGSFLAFPYAACQRTTNKTFTANIPTLVTMDQNDFLNDCNNTGTDGIVVNTAGLYNYQFSIQFANTDTQTHTAWVWLRVNGVDVPGTGSKFDCPSKHGTSDGYLIAACNFYVYLTAGQHVDMYAAVDNTALYMEAYAAQTSPFALPSVPSVVATLSFVSRVDTV